MNGGSNHLRLTPRMDLNLGEQTRRDGVGHQVRQPLFGREDVIDAQHITCAILDPNQQSPASCVREGDERPQDALRRSQISLVFDRLPLWPRQEACECIHNSAVYSEAPGFATLPSRDRLRDFRLRES